MSEKLEQNLATGGLTLSPAVVPRWIDSHVLHADGGTARIASGGARGRRLVAKKIDREPEGRVCVEGKDGQAEMDDLAVGAVD